ncbi:MAG: sugar ABC transporter permease [Candidatus Izemoplasmatales bacterium]|nr:sugar ABC transporter permease [Candidatus Izemoplasmatales bacterium]MDY0139434.1 sugar ABC transporter permease [Candidatus Izemoplasmatales bacterium]
MDQVIKLKKKRKLNRADWRTWVIFLPGILFVLLFTIYPILKMFVMSFFDWNIGFQATSPFMGLQNYVDVLTDPIAIRAIINTFVYAIVTVPLQMIIGLAVALLINGIKRLNLFFRLGYYLPVITSWVVVALLFRYIFANSGLMNYFLVDVLGVVEEPVNWLGSRWSALASAMLLGVWKGIGWNMIIFLAALQAVPKNLYEAADIDGASRRQKFFYITLPSIKGTVTFALVMLSIGAFNTYTPIAILTGGNPMHQTEVVLTWMYFQTFEALNMGYSAALSMIVTGLIMLVTVFLFGVTRGKKVA